MSEIRPLTKCTDKGAVYTIRFQLKTEFFLFVLPFILAAFDHKLLIAGVIVLVFENNTFIISMLCIIIKCHKRVLTWNWIGTSGFNSTKNCIMRVIILEFTARMPLLPACITARIQGHHTKTHDYNLCKEHKTWAQRVFFFVFFLQMFCWVILNPVCHIRMLLLIKKKWPKNASKTKITAADYKTLGDS